jgi:hypothetical protein
MSALLTTEIYCTELWGEGKAFKISLPSLRKGDEVFIDIPTMNVSGVFVVRRRLDLYTTTTGHIQRLQLRPWKGSDIPFPLPIQEGT